MADATRNKFPEEYKFLSAWRSSVSEPPRVRNRSGQIFEPEDLRRLGS